MDDKVEHCVFLGYSSISKGCRCYDLVTRYFYYSLNATFLETVLFFTGHSPSTEVVVDVVKEDDSALPRPVPIFEISSVSLSPRVSLPSIITTNPVQIN